MHSLKRQAAKARRYKTVGQEIQRLELILNAHAYLVDHGDDLVTVYFHLDRIDVREGDVVDRGQVIGTVGSTGRVTGPHLHFGARWHGARIDPTPLLSHPDRIPERIGSAEND